MGFTYDLEDLEEQNYDNFKGQKLLEDDDEYVEDVLYLDD